MHEFGIKLLLVTVCPSQENAGLQEGFHYSPFPANNELTSASTESKLAMSTSYPAGSLTFRFLWLSKSTLSWQGFLPANFEQVC